MTRLLLAVSVWLGLSCGGLLLAGLHPVLPLPFLALVVLLVPESYGLSLVGHVERRMTARGAGRFIPPLGVLGGCALLAIPVVNPTMGLVLLCLLVLDVKQRWGDGSTATTALGFVTLVVAYGAIWNTNYLALHWIGHRSFDPAVRNADQALYEWFTGHAIVYEAWFPVVRSGVGMAILEHAYRFMFLELFAAVFLLRSDPPGLHRYLNRLVVCYATGLLIFCAIPVAGPYLAFPESFSPSFSSTQTYQFMHAGHLEFSSIRDGGQPVTGFGYFVGLPSLHAALAVLLLVTVRVSPLTFWMLVPVNIAVLASTALLGYHYILDTLAGMTLVPIAMVIVSRGERRWQGRRHGQLESLTGTQRTS